MFFRWKSYFHTSCGFRSWFLHMFRKVRDKYSIPEFMYLHIEPAVAVLSHHYILLSFVYSYTSAGKTSHTSIVLHKQRVR